LEELLRIELQHRRRLGEAPSTAEYERRFADHAVAVHAAFRAEGLPATGTGEPPDGAPRSDRDRIDGVVVRFRAGWAAGRRPRLEAHLAAVGDPARHPKLFAKLLGIELRAREALGEVSSPGEYSRRFPGNEDLIGEVFADLVLADPSRPAQGQQSASPTGVPSPPEVGPPPTVTHRPGGQAGAEDDVTASYSYRKPDGRVEPLVGPMGHATLRRTFPPGSVLQGRYVIEGELGHGGMGLVYRGRDRRLGDRPVAIKVILPDERRGTIGDDHARAGFEEEARLGANLVHPAIATVYDFGLHEGVPFTVFEYISGETLGQLLKRRGRLPLEEVRLIIGPLAQALDYAHARGVVHRDLKPSNIKATEQAQLKILDLGLAKEFRRPSDWSGFEGTPAYASPEQASGLPCDGRTDQYSLGLIAYELLTGERAFKSKYALELLEMHRTWEPPSAQALVPALDRSVNAAILRSLEKSPGNRFGTCEQFAIALGYQPISVPAVDIEPICRSLVRGSFRSRTEYHILTIKLHACLTDSALWLVRGNQVVSWPLGALRVVYKSNRNLVVRNLKYNNENSTYLQNKYEVFLKFNSQAESEQWAGEIMARAGSAVDTPVASSVGAIVLTRHRPEGRFQFLGQVSARAPELATAEYTLKVQAAARGAEGVTELDKKKVVTFEGSEWRVSGFAMRPTDDASRRELGTLWFTEHLRRAGYSMAFFVALSWGVASLLYFILPGLPLQKAVARTIALLFLHLWPLAIALAVCTLAWPQLARPAGIAVLGLGAMRLAPLLLIIALIPINPEASKQGIFILEGWNILWCLIAVFLSLHIFFNINKIINSYRSFLYPARHGMPPERSRTIVIGTGLSCAFSITVFLLGFWPLTMALTDIYYKRSLERALEETHRIEGAGYSISLPASWETTTVDDGRVELICTSPSLNAFDPYCENIIILREAASSHVNCDMYMQSALNKYVATRWTEHERGEDRLGDIRATWYLVSAKVGSMKLTILTYTYCEGNRALVILCTGWSPTFSDYGPIFRKSCRSLTINQNK
jgi:serine/threonine protein kinase